MMRKLAGSDASNYYLLLAFAVYAAVAVTPAVAQEPDAAASQPSGPVTILDGSGVWRALYSFGAPLVQTADGVRERREEGYRKKPYDKPDFRFLTQYPPAGWTQVDFDDSVWPRRHFFYKYANGEWDARAGGSLTCAASSRLPTRPWSSDFG
jgi:hypothetical protein